MTLDEIYSNLCYHDARNPEAMTVDPEWTGPENGCTCDNCFYRRHELAEEALRLLSRMAELLDIRGLAPGSHGVITVESPHVVPPMLITRELDQEAIGRRMDQTLVYHLETTDLVQDDVIIKPKTEHPFAEFMGDGKKKGRHRR